jgi:hypothetical protein
MKSSRRLRWGIVFVLIFTVATVFLTQVELVRATFSDIHAASVLLRVEKEIMQTTPAGQYYEALFWKHNDELIQIMKAHPEHREEMWRVTRLFVPELEALLNGEGDEAYITSEHVTSVKAELDWYASVGSSALQEDIAREQERLPLDHLIGMTMSDALDYVNSSSFPDSSVDKSLVPDSDGMWAYYVHQGVYLEYPASYNLQLSETETEILYFVPTTGFPESWNPCVMRVRILHVVEDPFLRPSAEVIAWESMIENPEFPGTVFLLRAPHWTVMNLAAYHYNLENQVAVEILVLISENPQVEDGFDYSEMIGRQYEYLLRMEENLHIVKP